MSTNYVETYGWDSGRDRRSPFAWLSRLGIGLLSFFANITESTAGSSGSAGGSSGNVYSPKDEYTPKDDTPQGDTPIPDDKCCGLARLDRECQFSGDKSNYTCPEGFQKSFWDCCEGTRLIGCGECSTGPSCFQGPWDCSIWWWMDGSC